VAQVRCSSGLPRPRRDRDNEGHYQGRPNPATRSTPRGSVALYFKEPRPEDELRPRPRLAKATSPKIPSPAARRSSRYLERRSKQTERYGSAQAAAHAECGPGLGARMGPGPRARNVAAIRARRQHCTHALLRQETSKRCVEIPVRSEIKVTSAGAACRALPRIG